MQLFPQHVKTHVELYHAYCGNVYITKTTIKKTTTQGFRFSFQGGGKWSTPEGRIQWSEFGLTGEGGMFYLWVKDFDLK